MRNFSAITSYSRSTQPLGGYSPLRCVARNASLRSRRSLGSSVSSPQVGLRHTRENSTFVSSSLQFGTPMLHQRRLVSGFNKFEAVAYAGRPNNVSSAFNPLDLNLFDDPTGGLTAGPAEELPTADIASQVRLCVDAYSRSHFYLLYTPFVDVISIVLQRGLAPNVPRPGEVISRWFTDAVATLQNPKCVEESMGVRGWRLLCEGLDEFYEDAEAVMPLTAAVRRHGLPQHLLVPFMRQLAMELVLPARRRAALDILPGLILGLANGRAPPELGFPDSSASAAVSAKAAEEAQRKRAVIAADLFLSVGQETGNTDFAYLGIQLLRANSIPVSFSKQKQLTNVFAAATRIQNDWQMRASGQLVEVLPKWMDYYKSVFGDNMRAMKRLHEDATAVSEDGSLDKSHLLDTSPRIGVAVDKRGAEDAGTVKANAKEDGVHEFLDNHRAENSTHLAELRNCILQTVVSRKSSWCDGGNHLFGRFKRRKFLIPDSASEKEVVNFAEVPGTHLDGAGGSTSPLTDTHGGPLDEVPDGEADEFSRTDEGLEEWIV
ncbi:hypothetical protein TRVL_04716 [Trypanosoma vivax]|nr:hypothetical protein TRVL_04716 [Trypanosoma vivax]